MLIFLFNRLYCVSSHKVLAVCGTVYILTSWLWPWVIKMKYAELTWTLYWICLKLFHCNCLFSGSYTGLCCSIVWFYSDSVINWLVGALLDGVGYGWSYCPDACEGRVGSCCSTPWVAGCISVQGKGRTSDTWRPCRQTAPNQQEGLWGA